MTLLKRLQEDAVAKFETQIRVQYINQTDLENVIANTVTAVLDEIEREVESRIKEWEASEDNDRTLNDGLYSLRQFIKAKRTEI